MIRVDMWSNWGKTEWLKFDHHVISHVQLPFSLLWSSYGNDGFNSSSGYKYFHQIIVAGIRKPSGVSISGESRLQPEGA